MHNLIHEFRPDNRDEQFGNCSVNQGAHEESGWQVQDKQTSIRNRDANLHE